VLRTHDRDMPFCLTSVAALTALSLIQSLQTELLVPADSLTHITRGTPQTTVLPAQPILTLLVYHVAGSILVGLKALVEIVAVHPRRDPPWLQGSTNERKPVLAHRIAKG
jgi:hypothetical protein